MDGGCDAGLGRCSRTTRPDGTLKYRVRLVACGYSQKYGRDYDKTFAPTCKYKSFCTVMHLAAIYDWPIVGIDVENAYLEADIDKDVYMLLPQDIFEQDGLPIKVKLLKSLYGLKQAGELWNTLLNSKLVAFHFRRLAHDQCVYVNRNEETGIVTIILLFVDDIIVTGNNRDSINSVVDHLIKSFRKITELGETTRYIGIDIIRDHENHTKATRTLPD